MKKRLILVIIVIGIVAGGVGVLKAINNVSNGRRPAHSASTPCTSAAKPCIELADNTGKLTGIKFNDFRFGSPGCIFYRMTVQDPFKEYCGGYNMEWIGPGQAPGVPSKV